MISEQDAINIATKLAQELSWGWLEPTHAVLRKAWFGKGGKWEIHSNYMNRGTKVRVVIDAETGAVLDKGYISR